MEGHPVHFRTSGYTFSQAKGNKPAKLDYAFGSTYKAFLALTSFSMANHRMALENVNHKE
jgi:hypothetical protein